MIQSLSLIEHYLYFFQHKGENHVFWAHAIQSPDWVALTRAGAGWAEEGRTPGSSQFAHSFLTILYKTRGSDSEAQHICFSGAEPEAAAEGAGPGPA